MGNCLYCNKELTGQQRTYCSKSCRRKTYAPNYGTPAYRPKPLKESDNCAACNKPLTGRQTKYCSIKCKHIALENSYPSQIRRSFSRKMSLVQQFGGQCRECGYNKNLAVLSFHHKGGKEFPVNRTMLGQRSIERVTREAAKCDLLCANCHLELHNPTLAANLLETYLVDAETANTPAGQCVCGQLLTGKQQRFCSRKCANSIHQNYDRQKQRGVRRKLELLQHLGGKCDVCGYAKNLAGLTFHHIDPEIKDYALDLRSLSNRTLESLIAEFEKCRLLCANCHAELHYPEQEMTRLTTQ